MDFLIEDTALEKIINAGLLPKLHAYLRKEAHFIDNPATERNGSRLLIFKKPDTKISGTAVDTAKNEFCRMTTDVDNSIIKSKTPIRGHTIIIDDPHHEIAEGIIDRCDSKSTNLIVVDDRLLFNLSNSHPRSKNQPPVRQKLDLV